MRDNNNSPAIRFAGFADVWGYCKLKDITTLITKGTTPLDKSNTGDVNFVKIENINNDTGEITITQRISRCEHDNYLRRSQLKENDILFSIAGTLGRVSSVNANILPANTNQALAIVRLKNGDNKYIKTYLKGKAISDFVRKNPTIGAQPNLSLEQVGNLEINLPCEFEQKQISSFFALLDCYISYHRRKYEKLVNLKKAMLDKLFPKNRELVPEVRFAGFSGNWERRKLGEIANRVVRKNTDNTSTLALTISAQHGLVDQGNYFNNRVASQDVSNYYLIHKGEFAYNKSSSDGSPFGVVKRLDLYEMGVLSTLYIVFEIKDHGSMNTDYLSVFFDADRWHKEVSTRASEGARNHGLLNISATDFLDIDVIFPRDYDEQEKIGEFFMRLSRLILRYEQELISLRNLKSALLEKMFV